jgi:hypothetical protein
MTLRILAIKALIGGLIGLPFALLGLACGYKFFRDAKQKRLDRFNIEQAFENTTDKIHDKVVSITDHVKSKIWRRTEKQDETEIELEAAVG